MYKNPNYQKEYRQKNKEKLAKQRQEYHIKNRENLLKKMSEYGKAWYKENKEQKDAQGKEWGSKPENKKKRVKYVQDYVKRNTQKVKAYNVLFNKSVAGKYRLVASRHKSRWQSHIFSIKDFEKITEMPCSYCGGHNETRGIDRKDNTEGYTKRNSVSCCKTCNYMKNNSTVENFLNHVQKIANFNTKT